MSKIKDMSGTTSGAVENFLCTRLHMAPIREKNHWIQIALNTAAIPQSVPAFIERHPPVEPNHIGASLLHRGKQGGCVGSEINDRSASLLQPRNEFPGSRLHVSFII